jgi:hypothetical protein
MLLTQSGHDRSKLNNVVGRIPRLEGRVRSQFVTASVADAPGLTFALGRCLRIGHKWIYRDA